MSKTTAALECAVADVIANRAPEGERQSARQRSNTDRAFARILQLIAPRIRHFVRQYGLIQHWDDAEQCCAIAVHRAIEAYDPSKAQFTTFVNWQIRGELQSLRFRLMTDQRPSAKKVEATTISLHQVAVGPEGEETTLESTLVDDESLALTERAASDYLARAATEVLIEEFVRKGRSAAIEQLRRQQPKRQLARLRAAGGSTLNAAMLGIDPAEVEKIEEKFARDREILLTRVFGEADAAEELADPDISKERIRQIGKRASRAMADLTESNPRFVVMADYAGSKSKRLAA
ncbi:sigma-70 family RNA polymerase sigma factor [Sphingomonas sp. KRR8]|uniref:sigma-70 family RNA polymerase sigma factor n=1 Tax=Sphingomonas sp. KRR8 TaxID=2942996 RepID=UPI0020218DC2|nr:sigma-70 family RNA polymerase sigma factor [Sphingomonas sp. KRR8]URD61392.1 sigma-70 family RNA polymerase sigma factor [Sphingomonas sp. KRR8]